MTLQQAIEENNIEQVRHILDYEPNDVNGSAGQVPLPLYAAALGYFEIVKYLVEYSRASMNLVDDKRRTILHYAVGVLFPEISELLAKYESTYQKKIVMGSETERLALNIYLLDLVGMNPVEGDKLGVTPYELVAQSGDKDLLRAYEERVGCSYEEMYHNPIRSGFFPDPSIVRVGEDYYMVNSSFIYFPCIPISHSRDLVHWEIIGHAITNPEWSGLGELEGGRGYWAPDISYDNGTFFITATYRMNDGGPIYRKQIVVSSTDPAGPYSKPAIIDEDGIDPSIFHEDGRHYMLLNRGARIFELNSDCTEQISSAKLLYYGDMKRAPEGPHLLKKDGYYYLFLAEGGTGVDHRITVMRSKELMGKYEPCPHNPILHQYDREAALQRTGHGKLVSTPDGRWYVVYLCGRMYGEKYSFLGRETALDPVTWTADGWPIINGGRGPSVLQKAPFPALQIVAVQEKASEKNVSVACDSHIWMIPREPEGQGFRLEDDRIYVMSSRHPMESVLSRNIVLRRQTSFDFTAQVSVGESLKTLQSGQELGLTCYYDENTWVKLMVVCDADGSYFANVVERIGLESIYHHKVELVDKDGLIFSVKTSGLRRIFQLIEVNSGKVIGQWQLDNVYYLCDEGISLGKRFTGAMVGVYAFAEEKPFTAEFCGFNLREGRGI